MGKPFDQWTIAVFIAMSSYCPAIFRGYKVTYVGVMKDKPKADNDNVFLYPMV